MELKKFYDNIKLENDKIAKYEDEEGNISIFPITALLCRCEFLKVDGKKLDIMKFNLEVDKAMKFEQKEETVPVQDPKIKNHIVDKNIIVNLMWKVTNGCGISQIFNSKDEALKLVSEVNNKYIDKAII